MKNKYEKILDKWAHGRQEADIAEVEKILDRFFPCSWEYTSQRGSHSLVVVNESFIGIANNYNTDLGLLIIPTKKGRHVKHSYLRYIVKAINNASEYNQAKH